MTPGERRALRADSAQQLPSVEEPSGFMIGNLHARERAVRVRPNRRDRVAAAVCGERTSDATRVGQQRTRALTYSSSGWGGKTVTSGLYDEVVRLSAP